MKTIGGIETNSKDVIKELRIRGHQVWVPSQNSKKPEWVKNGKISIISTSTFDPLTYLKLRKYKKKSKNRAAVVIHAHTTVEDFAGNFLPDKTLYNNIFKLWLKGFYSHAHLLITPSAYSKKCIEKIQTIMTYPIHAVSNGIRIDKFKKKSNYRSNFRKFLKKKYGVPLESTIILNVGLSWKKKGVKLFGNIAKILPQYYFIWVGPINKNPEIDKAMRLKNVIFTGFYDDIREPYYGADLFLNTSLVENQGIPLIEAAICRVPIVAKNLPAFDWIKHDDSCVKAEKEEEFIRGINKVLTDVNFRNKIIERAYNDAVRLHDFNKIGEKIEKLYKKSIKIKQIWDKKRENKKLL